MHQRSVTAWVAVICAGVLILTAMPAVSATQQIEPRAGAWKTWVLVSGRQLRLPPPEAAASAAEVKQLKGLAGGRAKAMAQIHYWDTGSPSYRWVEITLNQMDKKPISNPRRTRLMALVNVAIYDAMVAAWDTKYTYNRIRPSVLDPSLTTAVPVPNSPAYPSEQAVAAGAASTVLAYVYPDDAQKFAEMAEQAGHSRVLAGVNYPSDVTAGLELGRKVGALVVERAKADGSDARWTGSVPTEAGKWRGTSPLEPLAGTWKPWVLTSGSQFRPGPPPAYDSPQEIADLDELKRINRTFDLTQKALFYQTFDGIFTSWYNIASTRLAEYRLTDNAPKVARAYALMSVAHHDSLIACWDAKFAYWAIRPSQLDLTFTTLFPPPGHPTYPAAHGCASGAIAEIIAFLFPNDADGIRAKAEEAGHSRMWAGIHFRTDVVVGLDLGRKVAGSVIEWSRRAAPGK